MKLPTEQNIFTSIISQVPGLKDSDLALLNPGAPNSWTVLDKKNNEVWKVIKSEKYKVNHSYLEKDALARVKDDSGVVKYIREGFFEINNGIKKKKYPYLVFPYITSTQPLDVLIRQRKSANKPFTEEELKNIASKLVSTIQSLFEVDIIHQDVKPGNILVKKDGGVYLIDLGIAMFVDQDIKEIKKMKGPYAYLSPERLDLIADLSNSNKRKLSFTSDLFSVGIILFEMATLKRLADLVQPGELRNVHLHLVELGLPANLVNLVGSFLDGNILERQNRTSALFLTDWFIDKPNADARLWLQHGSNGIEYLEQFVEEHTFTSKWGTIFGADQIQKEGNELKFIERAKTVKAKGGKVAVDPCTHRLRFSDEHHSYLVGRDYWQMVTPGIFLNSVLIPRGKQFISQVIEFQEKFDPDILFSPYFIIENTNDKWLDANFAGFDQTYEIVSEKGKADKLYFGLFLSERCLYNDSSLDEILTQVLLNKRIKNIYLRLESCRQNSEPSEDPTYLLNVKKVIKTLSRSKNILLGFADIEALGWLGLGLNSIGINPDYEKRKSQVIDTMTKAKKSIPTPDKKPRYFAQKLLNDVFAQEELRSPQAVALGSKTVFQCNCPFCFIDGKDRRLDHNQSRKHFLWHFERFILSMEGKSPADKVKNFQKMLDDATKAYTYLEGQCRMRFNTSSDSSFILVWRSIITR